MTPERPGSEVNRAEPMRRAPSSSVLRSKVRLTPAAAQGGPPGRVYELDRTTKFIPRPKLKKTCLDSSSYPGQTVYRHPGERIPAPGDGVGRSTAPSNGAGLSNGHIPSPRKTCQVEVWHGAHAIQIKKPGERTGETPPPRGQVREFSRKSRQRMMATVNKIRMDDARGLPWFTANTFPDQVPAPDEVLRIWEVFWKRLERRFEGASMLWRKELQGRKSGLISKGLWVPHYHALLWDAPQRMDYQEEHGEWVTVKQQPGGCWVVTIYAKDETGRKAVFRSDVLPMGSQDRFSEWYSRNWYEAVGAGGSKHYLAGTRVEKLREANGVRFYVSKYISKVDAEEVAKSPHCLGRWWGVKGRNRIPWGERIVMKCTPAQASQLMRVARRYVRSVTGKTYNFSRVSMNVFVNNSGPWLRLVESVARDDLDPF